MRRRLIQTVLPLVFCVVPPLAAALIAAALPSAARSFYLDNRTHLDNLILLLGSTLFVVQTVLAWRALRWRGRGFDERPDSWLSNLAQAAEWFPLLGLIGTVAGLMFAFKIAGDNNQAVTPTDIAPAITATCSGLFMALANILPTWVVLLGRDLIRTLGGDTEEAPDNVDLFGGRAAEPRTPGRSVPEGGRR
jgi:hypothetical protein